MVSKQQIANILRQAREGASIAAAIWGGLCLAFPVWAGDLSSSTARGGRLYDNWYRETREKPLEKPQPAYPANGRYWGDPKANWRCKECHGWDYRGKDDAYSAGRHFTGIKGIQGMAGADPEDIIAVLKDKNHGYGKVFEYRDFRDLANFVSLGQVDMDLYIDRKTGLATGDKTRLAGPFLTICATCHGAEGYRFRNILPLGRLARLDPWRTLHIIANGHPDQEMPAMRALDIADLVDILAFVQSLPERP